MYKGYVSIDNEAIEPKGVTKGRLVYIEPNDLASIGEGYETPIDNVSWRNEDLRMEVDLQVVIPDRTDCGTFSIASNEEYVIEMTNNSGGDVGKYVSFMQGENIGGNNNELTTSYINASYMELKSSKVSNKECLGIESIDINFDQHFFPVVNIKFIDVRGYSLMMPTEDTYRDSLLDKIDSSNARRSFTNFFRAIFHFPYPKFLLTVKGYYGNPVTFILAPNEFRNSFNSETGNFEVNVSFIGYKYGLYSDLPFNFLLSAPYYNRKGDEEFNDIWNKNKGESYVYDSGGYRNGSEMASFAEYIKRCTLLKASLDMVTTSSVDSQTAIAENVELQKELNSLNDLRRKAISLYQNTKELNKTNDGITFNDEWYYIVQKAKEVLNEDGTKQEVINPIAISPSMWNNFKDGWEDVNGYTREYMSNIAWKPSELWDSVENKWRTYPEGENIELSTVRTDGKGMRYIAAYFNVFINAIDEEIAHTKSRQESLSDTVSLELDDRFLETLEFTPTVKNFFRMLFAHLSCFMGEYYALLGEIKKMEETGERTLSALGVDKNLTDMNKNATNDAFIPPFPSIFTFDAETGRRVEVYPGDLGEGVRKILPEVNFVEGMINGIFPSKEGMIRAIAEMDESNSVAENLATLSQSNNIFPTSTADFLDEGYRRYANDGIVTVEGLIEEFIRRAAKAKVMNQITNIAEMEAENAKAIIGQYDTIYNEISAVQASLSSGALAKDLEISVKVDLGATVSGDSVNIPYKEVWGFSDIVYCEEGQESSNCKKAGYFVEGSPEGNSLGNTVTKAMSNAKSKDNDEVGTDVQYHYFDIYDKALKHQVILPQAGKTLYDYEKFLSVVKDNPADPKEQPHFAYSKFNDNELYRYMSLFSEWTGNANAHFLKTYNYYPAKGNELGTIVTKESPESHIKYWALAYAVSVAESCLADSKGKLVKDSSEYNEFGFTEDKGFVLNFGTIPAYGIYKATTLETIILGGFLQLYEETREKHPENLENFFKWTMLNKSHHIKIGDVTILPNLFRKLAENQDYEYEAIATKCKDDFNDYVTSFKSKMEPGPNLAWLWNILCNRKEHYYFYSLYGAYLTPSREVTVSVKKDIKPFVDNLMDLFKDRSEEIRRKTDINEARSEIDSNHKLALYKSLKNLYDKWANSYRLEDFAMRSPEEDLEFKRERFEKNSMPIGSRSNEFDNFVFVDCFYNDISDKFNMNPMGLFKLIEGHIKGEMNMSFYEVMAYLAQENKMLFQALPVYNNFYDAKSIAEIFTPRDKEYMTKGFGTTYMCMYTYEASHVVEDCDSQTSMSDDAIDLCGITEDPSQMQVSAYDDFFKVAEEEDRRVSYPVPAFGVTYARQNQMYFERIDVNMDNPRVTDYSIANLFALTNPKQENGLDLPNFASNDLYSIFANRSYNCKVDMMGCANIMPMMYFQLNNIPMFRGGYMISNVEHHITAGRFSTTFTGVRISKNQLPYNKPTVKTVTMIAPDGSVDPTAEYYGMQTERGSAYVEVEIPEVCGDCRGWDVNAALKMMTVRKDYGISSSHGGSGCHHKTGKLSELFTPDSRGYAPALRDPDKGSYGCCAAAVKTFMYAGFISVSEDKSRSQEERTWALNATDNIWKMTNGWDFHGSNALNYMRNMGFTCIYRSEYTRPKNGELMKSFMDNDLISYLKDKGGLQPGDVIGEVYAGGGHVQMWNGKYWVSDFPATHVFVVDTKKYRKGSIWVYRFTGMPKTS